MAAPSILLTGATGFIGFKVLLGALQAGYSVRVAVRDSSRAEWLKTHPKITALGVPDQLSFFEVPDICLQDAYDTAVRGVTYIIHLASPLPSRFLDPQTAIYEPNVKSATAVLHAAHKEPLVKKIVITSSIFANIPFPPDPSQRITADSRLPDIPGPFDSMLPAYCAGKVAAINAIDRFIEEKHPVFAVTSIFPGFVFGKDDRASSLSDFSASTNRILLSIITGQTAPDPMVAGATHVADAALVHLMALKDGVAGNLGVVKPHVFDDAWDVVTKHFPGSVKDGTFTQGFQPTIPVNWDAHQTEVDLGIKFKDYESMVVDVATQYLELTRKD